MHFSLSTTGALKPTCESAPTGQTFTDGHLWLCGHKFCMTNSFSPIISCFFCFNKNILFDRFTMKMLPVPFSLERKRNQKIQDGPSCLKINFVPLKELKCRVHIGSGGVGGRHQLLYPLHFIDFLHGSKLSLFPCCIEPSPHNKPHQCCNV